LTDHLRRDPHQDDLGLLAVVAYEGDLLPGRGDLVDVRVIMADTPVPGSEAFRDPPVRRPGQPETIAGILAAKNPDIFGEMLDEGGRAARTEASEKLGEAVVIDGVEA